MINTKNQLLIVALTIATALISTPAAAAPVLNGGGSIDGNTVSSGISVSTPGGARSGGTPGTPLVSYTLAYQYRGNGSTTINKGTSGWCAVPGHPLGGFMYELVGIAADGSVVVDRWVCVPFADPGVQPPPPPQPQVPTVEEAWKAAHIASPSIVTDPPDRGITGLETRISTNGPRTVSVTANVRDYTITGTATLDHYTISIDGAPAKVADHDAFTFETKGNHTIVIGAVWKGEATLTGPDLVKPIHIGDIGTATITTTRTYPVHEIRSVLQP